MVHLEKTEKLGKELSRSIPTVCALSVGARVGRSVVLVVDVVTPVSSVPPPLRRGIVLIYGNISKKNELMQNGRKLTHQSNGGLQLGNRGW